MANAEFSPAIPDQPNYGREVLKYFLQQQADNPEFMRGLAKRLWGALSSTEKDAMAVTQATFFPDDPVGRQNSLNAQLVVEYIRTETAAVSQLEEALHIDETDPAA